MSVEQASQTSYQFKAEMKQLLNLIIHSLYTHPEVYVRELVSNSSDALNKIRFKKLTDSNVVDADSELKIKFVLDKENQTFSIEDTGIGMDKDDLINNLGTIAKSGTLDFIKQINENKGKLDSNMIGQFGVGFYSVFMVTDEITVETRKADANSIGLRWISNGEDDFTIEEIDRKERGTKISFKLKDEFKEFAEDWKIKSILNKYSNFVDFPVYLGDEKINNVAALWHRSKEEISDEEYNEFYKFVSGDFQNPMQRLHIKIEGNINFKSILFLPETAPPSLLNQEVSNTLHLYSNRVFIQEDSKDILPDYLRFVKGVVDTEDLPLNVSREVTQSSPVMAKIKSILTSKILGWLEDLANENKENYDKFYKNFGPLFKLGSNSDFANKDKIMKLLRFESTSKPKGEYISLDEYISNISSNGTTSKSKTDEKDKEESSEDLTNNEEQKEIYYIAGTVREVLEQNPNLEYFYKNKIEVLLLTDPSDVFTVPYLSEYKGKKIISIEKADLDINKTPEKTEEDKEQANNLLKTIKEILDDKVEDVVESKRLVDSPVTLIAGKEGMDPQMEKMMMMMDKNFTSTKKTMEINTNHNLIKNITKIYMEEGNSLKLRDAVNQIYDGASLLDGNLQSPNEFLKRMYEFMEKATN